MDIDRLLDAGLRLNWERRQSIVNGPSEFRVEVGDWTALIWFTTQRGTEEWVVQVWNRTRPDLPSIDSIYDDYAGYLTANAAMWNCEHWIRENA